MHELEYSLMFLGVADDRRAVFSVVLVGNRIADSAFIFAALVNVAGEYRSARSSLASKPSPRLPNKQRAFAFICHRLGLFAQNRAAG
jgi:hypothetical protein